MSINYDQLLDLATELGFRLMETGAEIYRVEESVQYILRAYGVETGEVFAIPNCLIVSLTDTAGHASTRVRRIPAHGTDISLLEAYNEFCRNITESPPPLEEALKRMEAIRARHFVYPFPVMLLAYFVGGGAYSLFFGGDWTDGVCGGLCGVAIGLCLRLLAPLGANSFVRTIAAGAVAALSLEENRGKLAIFGGVKNARFKQPVLPGDVLELSCELVEQHGPIGFGRPWPR